MSDHERARVKAVLLEHSPVGYGFDMHYRCLCGFTPRDSYKPEEFAAHQAEEIEAAR